MEDDQIEMVLSKNPSGERKHRAEETDVRNIRCVRPVRCQSDEQSIGIGVAKGACLKRQKQILPFRVYRYNLGYGLYHRVFTLI